LPPLVDGSTDVPRPYPGASAVVEAGSDVTVTTTTTNYGRREARDVRVSLDGPSGWSVRATTPTRRDALGSGSSFDVRWTVGVPAAASPGTYAFETTISYPGGRREQRFEVVVPPPVPTGTTNLGDAAWLRAVNGWGPVERNTSNGETPAGDGRTITIQGRTYATGLGAHAPGVIEFYVGARCSSLTTDVGVDDEKAANGTVTFEIWADDRKVADSGVMDTAMPAKTLTADLTGATLLRLVVTDAGDGTNSDHADWADPRLTCT
jgi:alpha-galactosidase